MKKSRKEKEQLALELFLQDYFTQEEICNIIEITPRTLYNWKTKNNWETIKKAQTATREKVIQNLYERIYELSSDKLNAKANAKEIAMLSNVIHRHTRESKNPSAFYQFARVFTEYMKRIDLDVAKTFNKYFKEFIQEMVNNV